MYKKILVINLMHLGDLMLVTPILRTLRANFPESHIALVADLKLADVVRLNKNLDECIFLDKKGVDDSFFGIMKFAMKLREKKFDLVINLHRNERASAIAAFSGGKKIVGYSKPGFSLFFEKIFPNKNPVKHQIHSHFDVLREAVGIEKFDDNGLEMWIEPAVEEKIDQVWKENFSPEDRVIALNIGASWMTKRWLDDYFAVCADHFIEKNYSIIFLGGEMDRSIVEACRGKMKFKDSERLKIFTGKMSLAELGAVLSRCVLFISTDSGPMHVGVAMNVPIVTMFGASPVLGFYPYDEKDFSIKTPEYCHPCNLHECPRQGDYKLACMKNIRPEVVIKYAEQLLEEYGMPAREIPRRKWKYISRVISISPDEARQIDGT